MKHRRLAEEVSAAISFFEELVRHEVPANAEALTKARLRLVQAVNAYIAYLGSRVETVTDDVRRLSWKGAHRRVVELRQHYSEHIGRFSAATIMTDWHGYRASCRPLIGAMREHLDQVSAWTPID